MSTLQLIQEILLAITHDENGFEVDMSSSPENGIVITARVDDEHLGRVIGKKGQTADALRSLLHPLGRANNARYSLRIEKR